MTFTGLDSHMRSRTRLVVVAVTLVGVIGGGAAFAASTHSSSATRAPVAPVDHAHMHHDMPSTGAGDDTDMAHSHAHGRDFDALWAAASPDERAAAIKLFADTKAAVAKYANYDVALAAGYRPNPTGGPNATHYPNPALMRDGKVLDPSAPESLMYRTTRDGRKVLIGAVFKTRPSEDAPAPGGALTMWHTHAGTDTMCHPAVDPECPQHTGKMLHVFIFPGVHDPFTENARAASGGAPFPPR